jgi:hypothetical protein
MIQMGNICVMDITKLFVLHRMNSLFLCKMNSFTSSLEKDLYIPHFMTVNYNRRENQSFLSKI